MKKIFKKAFTLVELLVVIAILATLAMVGIVSYNSFKRKADKSNDDTLVAELNRYLAAATADGTKYNTVSEVAKVMEEEGFKLSKLNPRQEATTFSFDLNSQKFALLNKDSTPSETTFAFVDSDQEYKSYKDSYAIYLQTGVTIRDFVGENKLVHSFDAGEVRGIASIEYTSDATKNISIYTNGGDLIIDAKNATINHYGFSDTVEVKRVAMNSFHEQGEVSFFAIKSGNLVLEQTSDVKYLYFESEGDKFLDTTTNNGIQVDLTNAVNIPEYYRDQVTINKDNGTKVCDVKDGSSTESVWLWLCGIEEQMKITEPTATKAQASDKGIADKDTDDESASLAKQICNNVGRDLVSNKPLSSSGSIVELNPNGTFAEGFEETKLDDFKLPEGQTDFVKEKESVKTEAIVFSGGNGEKDFPFMIRCRDDFEFIYSHYDSYYYYYVDVNSGKWSTNPSDSKDGKAHMDASNWALKLTDDGKYITRNNIFGSLEGNGLVIDNLDTWLFYNVGNSLTDNTPITISNLTLNMDWELDGVSGVAAVARNLGCKDITFNNVDVTGTLMGNTNTGSYFGYGVCNFDPLEKGCDYTVRFIDCESSADIYDIGSGSVGGLFAHPYAGTGFNANVVVNNSEFKGTTFTKDSNSSHSICAWSSGFSVTGATNDLLSSSKRKVITNVNISKNSTTNECSVVVPDKASYAIINVFAQYTQYDDQNVALPNLGGITVTLNAKKVEGLTKGSTLVLLDAFKEVHETTGNERMTSELKKFNLTDDFNSLVLNMLGNQDGRVYVKVTFFNEKGELLSTGTLEIASKAKADFNKDNWVIK